MGLYLHKACVSVYQGSRDYTVKKLSMVRLLNHSLSLYLLELIFRNVCTYVKNGFQSIFALQISISYRLIWVSKNNLINLKYLISNQFKIIFYLSLWRHCATWMCNLTRRSHLPGYPEYNESGSDVSEMGHEHTQCKSLHERWPISGPYRFLCWKLLP